MTRHRCKKCGKEIPPNKKKCSYCHKKLKEKIETVLVISSPVLLTTAAIISNRFFKKNNG